MGFSTIGASIVLFIGMLFVASTVLSASFDGQRDVMQAVRDDRQRNQFERDSDAEITNGEHQGNTLTIEILNTGGTALDASLIAMFFDGEPQALGDFTRDVDGKTTDVWAPGETLTLEKGGVSQGEVPNRAFVVLETGKGLLWDAF